MFRRMWLVAVLSALVATSATSAQRTLNVPSGAVERVIDGDTLVVAGVGTVRLIGVDTPETVDPRRAVQHFGAEASAFLRQLVIGQVVRLAFEGPRHDRYGRVLAYLYLSDGTFVNREIVRQGYGHVYTRAPFAFLDEFRALEREAREAGRGLWAEPVPRE